MSDRPTSGAGDDASRPLPPELIPDPARPPGQPPDPDTPLIPVPNALLDRTSTDHLPDTREDYRPVGTRTAVEQARAALDRLTADPDALPPFHLPAASSRHPAVVAAATCPDVFLLDAPAGPVRILVTADIAEQCAAGKQRVLLLTPDAAFADAVTERLARRGDVLRLLGPGEPIDRMTPAVLARTETVLAVQDAADRRARLEQRIADRTAAVAAIDEFQQHADGLHPDEIAAVVEASEASRAAAETHAAVHADIASGEEADAKTRAELEAELAELKAHVPKPAGLFKRLIGGSKPDPETTAKLTTVEETLAGLAAAATNRQTRAAAADEALRAERDRLVAEETARRRTEHNARTASLREQWKRLGIADRPDLRDHMAAELADATAELATVKDLPPMLSADARANLGISVAVFAADPPADGFDRVVFAAAEAVTEAEYFAASAAGNSWVLIGQSGPVVPPPRGSRSARPFPPPFFCALWNAAHRGLWTPDFFAPTVRLAAVPPDRQHTVTCEPLADWPDVELRLFESAAGDPVLTEVRFPTRMPLEEIKRFLAEELDDRRLITVGPARWHGSGDQLTCCWPAGETPTGRAEWVTLPGGIKEKVSDAGPAGLTVAVSFDPAVWTRAAAEAWVAENTGPTPRTAVLPR